MDAVEDSTPGHSRSNRKCSFIDLKLPLTEKKLEEQAKHIFSDSGSEFEFSEDEYVRDNESSSDYSDEDDLNDTTRASMGAPTNVIATPATIWGGFLNSSAFFYQK